MLHPVVRARFNVFDCKLRLREMRTLLKVGIPSGVQVFTEVLAWAAWGNIVMATFGTKAMAGTNFVFRYMSVSFMPAFGIGTAVTALVGRYIGRGRPDIAMRRAHLGFSIAVVYMVACAVGFVIFRRPLIGIFASDPQVIAIGATMLVFAAIYQLFDCASRIILLRRCAVPAIRLSLARIVDSRALLGHHCAWRLRDGPRAPATRFGRSVVHRHAVRRDARHLHLHPFHPRRMALHQLGRHCLYR